MINCQLIQQKIDEKGFKFDGDVELVMTQTSIYDDLKEDCDFIDEDGNFKGVGIQFNDSVRGLFFGAQDKTFIIPKDELYEEVE